MLVFVCKTGFEQEVELKLRESNLSIVINDISIAEIDAREVSTAERKKHSQIVESLVNSVTDLVLRYESLIYFYSPFHQQDQKLRSKVKDILGINEHQHQQLDKLLLQYQLASRTGDILWLKQPLVAKDLLKNYIDQDIFIIEDLIDKAP